MDDIECRRVGAVGFVYAFLPCPPMLLTSQAALPTQAAGSVARAGRALSHSIASGSSNLPGVRLIASARRDFAWFGDPARPFYR